MSSRRTEVVVVGAGPVGLFTALCLAEAGIQVEVVDEQWRTAARSYALALHPASVALLEAHGLAKPVFEAAHRVDAVEYYDERGRRAAVSYGKLEVAHPYLLIVPQQVLESLLEHKLAERKVKVHWNHRLASLDPGADRVRVGVEVLEKYSTGYSVSHTEWLVAKEIELDSAFVVGTDGHRSAVRRKMDIAYDPVGPADVFAVYEFSADMPASHEVRVSLRERDTSVLWPMRDGRFRWSFELSDAESLEAPRVKSRLSVQVGDQSFPHLDEDGLKERIAERAPWMSAKIQDVFWSLGIRFDRRLAAKFGEGRVWLAGDSAHLAGPVGIHSMNVGLREGAELARILSGILRGQAKADELAGYDADRRAEWKQLLGLESPPEPSDGVDPWVAERAARLLACSPASGPDLRVLMQQIGLRLPRA